MCGGGGPKPAPREAPAPAPPPELRLTGDAAVADSKRKSRKTLATGRQSLVTPGLSLGAAAARTVTGALGIGGAAKRGK